LPYFKASARNKGMMEIKKDEHGKKGAFYIEENDEWVAEMTYVKTGDNEITIDHTEVDKALRGEGIARDLLAEAVKHARENGLKIKATCPYAKIALYENPEFKDVLAEQ
jgi:predicted GNAT family acetyltransferase